MKVLFLHCDDIRFKAVKKAISNAEESDKKEILVKECLVCFTAVEKQDEINPSIVEQYIENIKDVAKKVNTKTLVLYPYAHLSSHLSQPSTAMQILKETKKILSKDYKVTSAPFGWYKEFSIHVKGHPLSELSREINVGTTDKGQQADIKEEVDESKAIKAEKKLKSDWFILTPSGKLNKIEVKNDRITGFNFEKEENLEKFTKYEIHKVRTEQGEPAHVKLMRALNLVDYEKASDPGNFRYYPKGRLIKALLEQYVNEKVREYGALEVETPIMYDYEHPALKAYLNKFPARQYSIKTPNKKVFLRFSACFGQFLMAKDANISYKSLPLAIYELTKYSFRVEQRGELSGLRRLRTFTMPDCHAFCADMEQAKQELLKRFDLAAKVQLGCGLSKDDLNLGIRVTKDFYNKNKDFVNKLVKKWGKPVLLEMWPTQEFYFIMKYEFNFVDSLNKAAALATDQIDIGNAKNYGIMYVDKDNTMKHPIILHLSPSGAIERVIFALLEKAHNEKVKNNIPSLPLWLAPTQVRIIPVSEKFTKEARKIVDEFNKEGIRTDLDERALHVQKKIMEAEQEWIPYVVVLGEREIKSKRLSVRIRKKKDN
ncbi:MAG: threonine--tRNA ligase, partial [Nanoarchaeota archaeon]|nr:threonine--tRNA ligase [Nanoarchaeota archaeon]